MRTTKIRPRPVQSRSKLDTSGIVSDPFKLLIDDDVVFCVARPLIFKSGALCNLLDNTRAK